MYEIERSAIRNADRRPETPAEREIARVFEGATTVELPKGVHPRSLYEQVGTTMGAPEGQRFVADVAAAAAEYRQAHLEEARDQLVEHRLQQLARFWRMPERKMVEMRADDEQRLPPDVRATLATVRAKKGTIPRTTAVFEVLYAELLRRTGDFSRVVLANEVTDILDGADLFVEIQTRREKRWAPIDLTTGDSAMLYAEKEAKDMKEVLPKPASTQDPSLAPDQESVLFKRVEYMDYYVMRGLFERLQSAARTMRIVPVKEIWAKGPEGWVLFPNSTFVTPGMETWQAPHPPVLQKEEFMLLAAQAFNTSPGLRSTESAKYDVPDPFEKAVAKWPKGVEDVAAQVRRDHFDAPDPVPRKYYGWKGLYEN